MPIYKDKNNTYFIQFDTYVDGKRKQKKRRGFKTKSEAKKALTAIESEINKGTYIEPSSITIKELLSEWIEQKKATIKIQTYEVYEILINKHVLPRLGDCKLSNLKANQLQLFSNQLFQEGYSPETIKKIFNIIRNLLDYAEKMELISTNVSKKVQLPSIANFKESSVWNDEEMLRFLDTAKTNRYFIVFHLALMTGLRQGEILGLRWKDVNFKKGILTITQTLSHDGKKILQGAKSKSSIRSVCLHEDTITLLEQHKDIMKQETMDLCKNFTENDLIVYTQNGTPVVPRNIVRTFKGLVKTANIPLIRFHDLRHTHATYLISRGLNPKIVADRLGHSDTRMTLDRYSHLLSSMQQEAVKALDDLYPKDLG